jgi:hypothetical protein
LACRAKTCGLLVFAGRPVAATDTSMPVVREPPPA